MFFYQAEDGIRDDLVTGVQTCALPILSLNNSLQIILKNSKVEIKDNGEVEIEGGTIKVGLGATEKGVLGDLLLTALSTFISEFDSHTHGTPPVTPVVTTPAQIGRASCRERV